MKEEYISEETWSKILVFFKSFKGIYVGDSKKCKNFMEAIYWMSRTGVQWREMHEKYGNWNSVYKRFNAWSKKNVWDGLLNFCIQDPDLEYVMIDSTIVRAHACSAGYGEQVNEGLGRSKGGFSSKIHAKVDALGNPLQFIITPGQQSDYKQAQHLISGLKKSCVMADKAYDSTEIRIQLKKQNCTAVIPSKINRKHPYKYDKYLYKERHVIECFFSKIKYFRRLFSRFDKSARNFQAFLSFVGAFLWLR